MYGVVTAVAAPPETYDRMHAALLERAGPSLHEFGLVLHVARATEGGFETFEVWQSEEHCRRAREMSAAMAAELPADVQRPAGQEAEVFEVRGLVVPHGDVVL